MLQVKSIFGTTIQGEGRQSGLAAIFVRFAGCNMWNGEPETRAASACPYCLTGDTRIATLDNRKKFPKGTPIKELIKRGELNPVLYTRDATDPSSVRLTRGKNLRLTRKDAETVIVSYSWWAGPMKDGTRNLRKEKITLTPDHRVLLLTGGWKQAGDLKPGDRLAPGISFTKGQLGYYEATNAGKWTQKEHRAYLETFFPEAEIMHHLDEKKWNNHETNLEPSTDSEHKSSHARGKNNPRYRKDVTRKFLISILKKFRSNLAAIGEAYPELNRDLLRRRITEFGISPEEVGNLKHQQRKYYSPNHVVTKIRPGKNQDVYCLDVPSTNLFSANNLWVHNCDTDFLGGDPMTAEAVAMRVAELRGPDLLPLLVVLSGGEPMLQDETDLLELCAQLRLYKFVTQVETNGTRWLQRFASAVDFVTVSPKVPFSRLKVQWGRVDCLKLLVPHPSVSVDDFLALPHNALTRGIDFCLQPIEPPSKDADEWDRNEKETIKLVKKLGYPWRLSLQIHKALGEE